ncbi:MAG TPA: hypothetical protein VF725_05085 [Ktedonobacterales bacterium]
MLGLVAVVVAVASVAGFLAFRGHAAAAAQPPHLNYGAQLNAAQCDGGVAVVDVTYKVLNDPDSSITGQNWAMDNFNKHVQVWQTGANSFCAIVTYNGDFTTLASNSPQDTDPSIPAGITGTSHGGYYALFNGTLNPSPAEPTTGNLGVVDLNSASLDWSQVYFGTDNLNLVWWGWIYRTPHNGTWVNACAATDAPNYNHACPGNAGDITG